MVQNAIYEQKLERDKVLSSVYVSRNAKLNLESGLINVIIGPRRAGKSYFGFHSLKNMDFGYANFDDERLVHSKDYDEIISAINQTYSSPPVLFFDEIQNLPNWELFVSRLQRAGKKIVITGSNSNLLSGELSSRLTGRNFPVYIYPFSFRELADASHAGIGRADNDIFFSLLEDGGYPEVAIKKFDSKEYLRMVYRDTVYKDIISRYKPREPGMVDKIASVLISGSCQEMSMNALAKLTGYNERTVVKYFSYLINTMLFFQLPRFSFKMKEQLKTNKKVYVTDNGFIGGAGIGSSPNHGKKLENLIAAELFRSALCTGDHLSFWKKTYEVDFVIQKENVIVELIQVSADISNSGTRGREMRALVEASQALKCDTLTLITKSEKERTEFEWYGIKKRISVIPAIEWFRGR